jgi:hypothetical protein
MELLWLVLTLVAVDLAALLFAADSRPGLQHSSRWPGRHSTSSGVPHVSRWSHRHVTGG